MAVASLRTLSRSSAGKRRQRTYSAASSAGCFARRSYQGEWQLSTVSAPKPSLRLRPTPDVVTNPTQRPRWVTMGLSQTSLKVRSFIQTSLGPSCAVDADCCARTRPAHARRDHHWDRRSPRAERQKYLARRRHELTQPVGPSLARTRPSPLVVARWSSASAPTAGQRRRSVCCTAAPTSQSPRSGTPPLLATHETSACA
jgi:hypothetical protein